MTLRNQIKQRILRTAPLFAPRELDKLVDDIVLIFGKQTSQEVKEVSNTPKPEYQHIANIFEGVEVRGVAKGGMIAGYEFEQRENWKNR